MLTFKFNEKLLDIPEFKPAIYYCDAENQYILLDKTEFDKAWEVEIKASTQKEYMITDVALSNIDDKIKAAHSMSNFTYYIMPYRYKK